jgi:hypothetical protein
VTHSRTRGASTTWLLSLALVSSVAGAGSLHAQHVTSVVRLGAAGRHVAPTSRFELVHASIALGQGGNTRAIRLLTAVGGTFVGFVVGATVGYRVLPHDCGGCDDPGLDAIIYGALVGIPVGAALGAAAPNLGSVCSFSQRVGRTLLGAGAGGAVGFLVGMVSTEGAMLITFPTFSVAGALGSLGRCWKAEAER